MAVPVDFDLTITRGDTETLVITFTSDGTTPINVAGRTYAAQVRSTPDSNTVKASFVCTVTNGAAGQVTCVMSSTESSLLAAGNYFWDLQENASGVINTLMGGSVVVLPDVTR